MNAEMDTHIEYEELAPQHFAEVVELGNEVHGTGYLSAESIKEIAAKSERAGHTCSFVALSNGHVVGFRLTYARRQWTPDKWCSPALWPVPVDQVCYFKCNTVSSALRGKGIGSTLLRLSIAAAKQQGATAGLAHIWLASPGNSAFLYFERSGGRVIARHPDKWLEDCYDGYECVICGNECHCEGAEMLIHFADGKS